MRQSPPPRLEPRRAGAVGSGGPESSFIEPSEEPRIRLAAPEERWEHGSEFHRMGPRQGKEAPSPWGAGGSFFGTGRGAITALIRFGREHRGWRRLMVPSYFCPSVVRSMVRSGLPVQSYPDSPLEPPGKPTGILRDGDVVLRVNFFGLRASESWWGTAPSPCDIIEDHTHDPWSGWARESRAEWCVASLRKSLPLPDGAVVWSPVGQSLPHAAAVTTEHREASVRKLMAMALKARYLAGDRWVEREAFRRLAVHGEREMARMEEGPSAICPWSRRLLHRLPVELWREKRRANLQAFYEAVEDLPWVQVLRPEDDRRCVPFSAVLLFESSEQRERVREGLIAENVFPAILWPLEVPGKHHREGDVVVSRRMLSVHCDMRYEPDDMVRVAELLRRVGCGG